MVGISDLHTARKNRKDEFYTQFDVIEAEVNYYKEHFKGKKVFCNCDDPKESQFWEYFKFNFKDLGLKQLVSTHYKPSTLFETSNAYKLVYNGRGEPKKTMLNGDGDFRSDECVELMKQADIVVTNPPFSLFREFVAQLIKYKKKFLIIGNMNATSYKEIFPLIQGNRMWMGCTLKNTAAYFRVPDDYEFKNERSYVENGCSFIRVKDVRWFTNLSNEDRNIPLNLWKRYTPEEYPKFDNYDAINVGVTKHIPMDYDGEMGVPITFLDKYNPKQFKIIGLSRYLSRELGGGDFTVDGKIVYMRIVIKRKGRVK